MYDNFDGIVISFGGFDLQIHASILVWLCICLVVGIVLVIAGNKFKKADPSKAPSGMVLVFEQILNAILSIVESSLGKNTRKYLWFYGTMIVLMLISNLSGLLGVQAPTSNLSVNIALAVTMWLIIQFNSWRTNGVIGKLKSWCEQIFVLFPINVLSDCTLPVSLSLRLFGNLLAGTIIMTLIYSLFDLLNKLLCGLGVVLFVVTPLLHAYFDIFSGFIQTYIFFTLSTFFLSQELDPEE
ncbi:MAG: F0F1 ATP synthase subunit A [Traorella sp.]